MVPHPLQEVTMKLHRIVFVLAVIVLVSSVASATSIPADLRKPQASKDTAASPKNYQKPGILESGLQMLQSLPTLLFGSAPQKAAPVQVADVHPIKPSALAVATVLLQCPPETPVPWFLNTAEMRAALRQVSVQAELLDAKETGCILAKAEEFAENVNLLRRRHQELWDAPPIWDATRYPDATVIGELLQANQSYRAYLVANQAFYRYKYWDYQVVIQETDLLYRIWDTVRESRCEHKLVTCRRAVLKKLRDEYIGPEMYYAGALPPNVPIWRFLRND